MIRCSTLFWPLESFLDMKTSSVFGHVHLKVVKTKLYISFANCKKLFLLLYCYFETLYEGLNFLRLLWKIKPFYQSNPMAKPFGESCQGDRQRVKWCLFGRLLARVSSTCTLYWFKLIRSWYNTWTCQAATNSLGHLTRVDLMYLRGPFIVKKI